MPVVQHTVQVTQPCTNRRSVLWLITKGRQRWPRPLLLRRQNRRLAACAQKRPGAGAWSERRLNAAQGCSGLLVRYA